MNKTISKLFLGFFLIFFMGSVFAVCDVNSDDVNITAPLADDYWSGTQDITWEILNGKDNTDCAYNLWYRKGAGSWTQIGTTDNNELSYSWDTTSKTDGSDYRIGFFISGGYNVLSSLFTIDNAEPTIDSIVLGSYAYNVANDSNTVTIIFSEEVIGFTADDITADNGDISDFNGDNNPIFTATFTADAYTEEAVNDITVGIDWTDLALNSPAEGASSNNYTIDTLAPTAPGTPTTTTGEYVNTAEYEACVLVTVPLGTSGAVAGDLLDLFVENYNGEGSKVAIHSGENGNPDLNSDHITAEEYVFTLCDSFTGLGTADGDKNITARIVDLASNPGLEGGILALTLDTNAPTPILTAEQTDLTNEQTIEMTATFDENVTDFNADDITLGNATLVDFEVDTNYTVYSFDINAIEDGEVTVDLNAGVATDAAGNPSEAATFSIEYDGTAPIGYTVAFYQEYVNSNNETAIRFDFTNAEVDTNYTYVITDGNTDHDVNGSGTIEDANGYVSDIDLSGLDDGELTLTVTLTDDANNTGAEVTDTITKDTVAPAITSLIFDPNTGALGIGDTITMTITADDNTYVESLITINTEEVTAFTNVGDNNYTVVYTIAEDDNDDHEAGAIPASVVLADAAGNRNVAKEEIEENTVAIDATRPTLTTVTIDSNNSNTEYAKIGDLVTITIVSDENLEDVEVTINGGATTLIAGEDPQHWSATQVMDVNDEDGIVEFTIDFNDEAGNFGLTVEETTDDSSVLVDNTAPVVDLGEDYYTTSEDIIYVIAGITEEGSGIDGYDWESSDEGVVLDAPDEEAEITMDYGLAYGTYTVTLTVTDNAGNEGTDSFDIIYSAMYGFEFAGHTGQGFSAVIEEDWFSEYRFEQMDIWNENLMVDTFLNSSAGPTDERLVSTDVYTMYIYDETEEVDPWVTVDSTDFVETNFYDLISPLNYIVFDLNADAAIGKSIRHIAEVE